MMSVSYIVRAFFGRLLRCYVCVCVCVNVMSKHKCEESNIYWWIFVSISTVTILDNEDKTTTLSVTVDEIRKSLHFCETMCQFNHRIICVCII